MNRYAAGARSYDLISMEPVYRKARVEAVKALHLERGARVLDVGCGTGLNLPLLQAAIGERGHVTGLDGSSQMLARARRKASRERWTNVTFTRGDVTLLEGSSEYDAAIATFCLSLIPHWKQGWTRMLKAVRVGGRVAVFDLGVPPPPWQTLAKLSAWLGGSDQQRAPRQAVEADTCDVKHEAFRGGYIHLAAGTVLPPAST